MQPATDFPIRVTVFETADEARRVVRALQDAGFTAREISVVCSQEKCEEEFAPFIEERPAGANTNEALTTWGLTQLGLGAAVVVAGVLTGGGVALVIAGAFAGLAAAGTFGSMMMTRGAEKELADYYDQAVGHGKILVAVETEDPERQRLADRVLGLTGTEPSGLPKESVLE